MAASATLNVKISSEEKACFISTAQPRGLSPSSALKVLIYRFTECGGFPFPMQREVTINFANPNLVRAKVTPDGKAVILPASWREDDDE